MTDSRAQDVFGSLDNCMKIILGDFFRHGFDGSGADNYYDAGKPLDHSDYERLDLDELTHELLESWKTDT